ncbi:S8 family serine peptidase [Duganella guangzhouensis]|nr:S8 family serine peptidase [Duganella guangzhouensis]
MIDRTPNYGSPSGAVPVTGERRQFLIAPRRHVHAAAAGVRPPSAAELHAHVTRIPGVEICQQIPGHKQSHHLSSSEDEAVAHYVVEIDAIHAHAIRASAGGRVIVEEDLPLSYGRKHEVDATPALHPQSAFDEPQARDVVIIVHDKEGRPVPEASVTVVTDGPAATGSTDARGQVRLQLTQLREEPVRTLFVRPLNGYWNKFLHRVTLDSAAPNLVIVTPLNEPNPDVPPVAAYGWGQRLMGLTPETQGHGGKGVKVAIVDSGADASHPFLEHVRSGIDLTDGGDINSWRQDSIGHGTHCAGVIGARLDQGASPEAGAMRGFAPEAEIHALKIFPGGQFSALVKALNYCIDHEIDVVNLSLGAPQISEAVEQKLIEAAHAGVAVIVAAGNSGGPVQYPAQSRYVLAVSALGMRHALPLDTWEQSQVVAGSETQDGFFSPQFSCFGPQVAVCAPGVGIVSTVPGNRYASDSGTSMAAPHVAGLAALLLSDPALAGYFGPRGPTRVTALFRLIKLLCSPVSLSDSDNRFGAGLPQLHNLRRLLGT